MTNSQLLGAWVAQKKPTAHNSNQSLYYVGRVLYSYGEHYPLAILPERPQEDLPILINSQGYSVTTARHTSAARMAIHYSRWSICPTTNLNTADMIDAVHQTNARNYPAPD